MAADGGFEDELEKEVEQVLKVVWAMYYFSNISKLPFGHNITRWEIVIRPMITREKKDPNDNGVFENHIPSQKSPFRVLGL